MVTTKAANLVRLYNEVTSLMLFSQTGSTKRGGCVMLSNKRIAILSGGGDCPGTNAVIRAIT